MIRAVQVITGLEIGRAEISLLELVSNLCKDRFSNEVVSLTDARPVAKSLYHGLLKGREKSISEILKSTHLETT